MTNAFDNTEAPHAIPRTFVRGDYVAWRNSSYVSDYPPASYTLVLNARLAGDSAGEQVVTAIEDSGDFLFEINSAAWDAGTWYYDLHVIQVSSSKRHTLKSGVIVVTADRAEDPDDPRSLPRKMVAELEALYYDRVTNRQIDQTSFDNGETSASRDEQSLRMALEYWRRRELAARRKYRALRGLPHSGRIRLRG